jgi:hypothetical protein
MALVACYDYAGSNDTVSQGDMLGRLSRYPEYQETITSSCVMCHVDTSFQQPGVSGKSWVG